MVVVYNKATICGILVSAPRYELPLGYAGGAVYHSLLGLKIEFRK